MPTRMPMLFSQVLGQSNKMSGLAQKAGLGLEFCYNKKKKPEEIIPLLEAGIEFCDILEKGYEAVEDKERFLSLGKDTRPYFIAKSLGIARKDIDEVNRIKARLEELKNNPQLKLNKSELIKLLDFFWKNSKPLLLKAMRIEHRLESANPMLWA